MHQRRHQQATSLYVSQVAQNIKRHYKHGDNTSLRRETKELIVNLKNHTICMTICHTVKVWFALAAKHS